MTDTDDGWQTVIKSKRDRTVLSRAACEEYEKTLNIHFLADTMTSKAARAYQRQGYTFHQVVKQEEFAQIQDLFQPHDVVYLPVRNKWHDRVMLWRRPLPVAAANEHQSDPDPHPSVPLPEADDDGSTDHTPGTDLPDEEEGSPPPPQPFVNFVAHLIRETNRL